MAKASKAGRTKTRLSPTLSAEDAARCNTAFLMDIAENLLAVSEQASIAGYMAYGPPGESAFFSFLPPQIQLFEAWRTNFGDTLADTIAALFELGHASACVLNADSPTLPPAILLETAEVLARPGDRAVLGPSNDGGYYLLGLKSLHHRLFEDIAWSTGEVARQTLERAREIKLPVHMLPEWYDVDDAEALSLLRGQLIGGFPFGPSGLRAAEARHTLALLKQLE